MNPIRTKHNVIALLVLAGLSTCSVALAQLTVGPNVYEPGKSVNLEASFSGAGASEITSVDANINLKTTLLNDQPGFGQSFTGTVKPIPKGYAISIPIPRDAATGDYTLHVHPVFAAGQRDYMDGKEFDFPVRIENPARTPSPKINVKKTP
jgi:hypothetical protein